MKQRFLNMGKGLVYFAVFFLVQLWAGVLFSVGATIYVIIRDGLSDPAGLVDAALNLYLDNAMLVTLISGAATVAAYVLSFTMRRKPVREGLSLYPVTGAVVCAAFLLGVGLNPLVSLLLDVLPLPESWLDAYAESAAIMEKGHPVVIFLASVVAAPVSEELAFRGLVYTRFKRAMPMWLAAILSSVLFGLLHGTLVWALYAALLGVLMTWIYERGKSVWASIAFHLGFNGCAQLLGLFEDWNAVLIAAGVLLTAGGLLWLIRTTKPAEKVQSFT